MVMTGLWHIEKRDELLRDIGLVTIRWGMLDLAMTNIAEIALNDRAAAVGLVLGTFNSGARRMSDFMKAIKESRLTPEEKDEITLVINAFKNLLTDRNELIHSPRVISYSVVEGKIRGSIKGISKTGAEAVLVDIKAHLDSIIALLKRIDAFYDDLHDRYEPDFSEGDDERHTPPD